MCLYHIPNKERSGFSRVRAALSSVFFGPVPVLHYDGADVYKALEVLPVSPASGPDGSRLLVAPFVGTEWGYLTPEGEVVQTFFPDEPLVPSWHSSLIEGKCLVYEKGIHSGTVPNGCPMGPDLILVRARIPVNTPYIKGNYFDVVSSQLVLCGLAKPRVYFDVSTLASGA